jgi:hypothetical protein
VSARHARTPGQLRCSVMLMQPRGAVAASLWQAQRRCRLLAWLWSVLVLASPHTAAGAVDTTAAALPMLSDFVEGDAAAQGRSCPHGVTVAPPLEGAQLMPVAVAVLSCCVAIAPFHTFAVLWRVWKVSVCLLRAGVCGGSAGPVGQDSNFAPGCSCRLPYHCMR